MSACNTYTIFKGCTLEQLLEAIEDRAHELGGKAHWYTDEQTGLFLGIRTMGDIHTIYFDYTPSYRFFKEIGKHLKCPWMEVRIKEGNHWDYTLMNGEEDIHSFSTFPQYFYSTLAEQELYRGNPSQLASTWDIPREHIERYLVNWGDAGQYIDESRLPFRTVLVDPKTGLTNIISGQLEQKFQCTGKAYPDDQYEYGDVWQVLDFIRALGGDEPPAWSLGEKLGELPKAGGRHRLSFPNNNDVYGIRKRARRSVLISKYWNMIIRFVSYTRSSV